MGDTAEIALLKSITALTLTGERDELMSDAALLKIKRIAAKTKRFGPHSIFLNGERPESPRETLITDITLAHAAELTDAKYSAFGSVTGKLESISVHRGNEFRIWDSSTGKPVRCRFTDEWEDRIKSYLRKKP